MTLRRIGAVFQRGQELDRRYAASAERTRDKIVHARIADDLVPVPSYRSVKDFKGIMRHNIGRVSIFVPATEITEEGPHEIRTAFIMYESSDEDRRGVRALTLLNAEGVTPYVSAEDLIPTIDHAGLVTWQLRPELAYDPNASEASFDFTHESQWLEDLRFMIENYDLRTLSTDDSGNRQAA